MDQSDHTSLGLAHYARILLRQWRLVVTMIVVSILVGLACAFLLPRNFTAKTTVNLNVITSEPFTPQRAASGLLDGNTEAAIARSQIVTSRAAKELGADVTGRDVRAASQILTSSDTTVVNVVYVAGTEDEAVAGADAVAEAYLNYRSEQASDRVRTMISGYNGQIEQLQQDLKKANRTLADASKGSISEIEAQAQQQQVLTEINDLLSDRNKLSGVDTAGGTVLSAAADNNTYAQPQRSRLLLTAAGVGLVLGVILSYLRNPFDRRVRSVREVSTMLSTPILAGGRPPRGAPTLKRDQSVQVACERILARTPGEAELVLADCASDPTYAADLAEALEKASPTLGVSLITASDSAQLVGGLARGDTAVLIFDQVAGDLVQLRWVAAEARANDTELLGVVQTSARPPKRSSE
ncbi:Wzz/FepE/Etk N-terminal domain-containing protein [Galactobacter sp.]|uniref:Wzz/FepE/Etk N-terminal domain-containing protein n=1 Tax=Galactobacter sp. TaxID=2676125 RepID=UPI0025B85CEF|nr:Wzz/FepE/Etk N-terminal domain-containing protein [Galactobacter sp.]